MSDSVKQRKVRERIVMLQHITHSSHCPAKLSVDLCSKQQVQDLSASLDAVTNSD
jgi:hypothetical protein